MTSRLPVPSPRRQILSRIEEDQPTDSQPSPTPAQAPMPGTTETASSPGQCLPVLRPSTPVNLGNRLAAATSTPEMRNMFKYHGTKSRNHFPLERLPEVTEHPSISTSFARRQPPRPPFSSREHVSSIRDAPPALRAPSGHFRGERVATADVPAQSLHLSNLTLEGAQSTPRTGNPLPVGPKQVVGGRGSYITGSNSGSQRGNTLLTRLNDGAASEANNKTTTTRAMQRYEMARPNEAHSLNNTEAIHPTTVFKTPESHLIVVQKAFRACHAVSAVVQKVRGSNMANDIKEDLLKDLGKVSEEVFELFDIVAELPVK